MYRPLVKLSQVFPVCLQLRFEFDSGVGHLRGRGLHEVTLEHIPLLPDQHLIMLRDFVLMHIGLRSRFIPCHVLADELGKEVSDLINFPE